MVKVCAVKSCPSGRKRKTAKGAPPVSFFRPSSAIKVLRWAQSLSIDLKPTDYVCQHHFKEEHIKLYEKIKIGQVVHVINSMRKTLKEDALPTVQYQSQIVLKPQEQMLFQKQASEDKKDAPEDIQAKSKQIKEEELQLKTVDSEDGSQSDTFKSLRNKIEKFSVLPPCWCYLKNLNQIEFMRVDPTTKQIINHILLNEDFSVTVLCLNNKRVKLNDKITSFLGLNKYLKSVEKWILCIGTQLKEKKYSIRCKGVIIGDEDLKKFKVIPRCKPCRAVRNQLLVRRSVAKVAQKVKANREMESAACRRHTESIMEESKRLKQMYEWVGLTGTVSLSHGKPT